MVSDFIFEDYPYGCEALQDAHAMYHTQKDALICFEAYHLRPRTVREIWTEPSALSPQALD